MLTIYISGDMAIAIEGPSKVHIDLEDAGNNSVNVYYKPTLPGDYVISILHSHQHIGGSPFTAKILPLCKLTYFNSILNQY